MLGNRRPGGPTVRRAIEPIIGENPAIVRAYKTPTTRALVRPGLKQGGRRLPRLPPVGGAFKSLSVSGQHGEPSGLGRGKDGWIGGTYDLTVNCRQRLTRKGFPTVCGALE